MSLSIAASRTLELSPISDRDRERYEKAIKEAEEAAKNTGASGTLDSPLTSDLPNAEAISLQYQFSRFDQLSVPEKLALQQQVTALVNSGSLSRQQLLEIQSAVVKQLHADANPASGKAGTALLNGASQLGALRAGRLNV
ncbi:MAG: hypothetical protein ACRYGK_11820 [Janthinobacterium lividum]